MPMNRAKSGGLAILNGLLDSVRSKMRHQQKAPAMALEKNTCCSHAWKRLDSRLQTCEIGV
jgi:hypothetical protein